MAAPHDAPTAAELVEAVREWIERDLMTSGDPRTKFQARVAVNALAIVDASSNWVRLRPPRTPAASSSWGSPTTPSWPPGSAPAFR